VIDETPMGACVAALSAAAMRIVGSTLPTRAAALNELAIQCATEIRVIDKSEQPDNSARMWESASADRVVERFVRRVTTVLRPGSDALRTNLRNSGRSVYRVTGTAKTLRLCGFAEGRIAESSLSYKST